MPKAVEFSAIEHLRNGRRMEIRSLRPQDRDEMLAAVGRTSTQSLYRRFFAVRRHFSDAETSFFLDVDFVSHVALVAVVDEDGNPAIAGGGRYVVVGLRQAKVAFGSPVTAAHCLHLNLLPCSSRR